MGRRCSLSGGPSGTAGQTTAAVFELIKAEYPHTGHEPATKVERRGGTEPQPSARLHARAERALA